MAFFNNNQGRGTLQEMSLNLKILQRGADKESRWDYEWDAKHETGSAEVL